MGTVVDSSVTREELCVDLAIDILCATEAEHEEQMTPEEVISFIQDVCIEARCRLSELPRALSSLYADATKRRDRREYGRTNFLIDGLFDGLERAILSRVA